MKQLFGKFGFASGAYSDGSEEIYSYTEENSSVYIAGRLYVGGAMNDGVALLRLFREKGVGVTKELTGVYIAVIYDGGKKTLTVLHDLTTSPLTVYYTVSGGTLYVATSLKRLLAESRIKRVLDDEAVEEFLLNGFVYSEKTLLADVFKLKAFHALTADGNGVRQEKTEYTVREMTKGEALDGFDKALENAVNACVEGEDEINLPLSGGFDSNYIAFTVKKNGKVPVNAFSVGGKFGKNELPVVEKNVKLYGGIGLNSALTDEDTLRNLPDIVWRLEGAVYEVGLFLQYELSRLVSGAGKKYLVCGECADQVMNQYYLDPERLFPGHENDAPIYYEFSEYPYIFGNYLILKKNGILANSFGIETRYPYLDAEVTAISHALRNINGKDKRVHTANCAEKLPREILANMSKVGGATECHSLFDSPEEIRAFIASVENTSFYKRYADVIRKHSYAPAGALSAADKLKKEIKKPIKKLLRMDTGDSSYFNEEMKLRETVCAAYLAVFEKLFTEDAFFADFGKESIDISLKDLL